MSVRPRPFAPPLKYWLPRIFSQLALSGDVPNFVPKLELFIPADAPSGRVLALPGLKPPTRPARSNYESVQDLTAHSPVKVYWEKRFNQRHKLQFVRVADLDAQAILTTIRDIFDIEPLDLHLMRVDFAVDLPIHLAWFAKHMTVDRKKRKDGYGTGTPSDRWEGTTLYYGKPPSVVLAYDKIAELRNRKRQVSDNVMTRIEHRVYGKALSRLGLHTLGDLLELAPILDPFQAIRLPDQAKLRAPAARPTLKTYWASIGLAKELERMSRSQLEVLYQNRAIVMLAATSTQCCPTP